jgi:hypothetical protein
MSIDIGDAQEKTLDWVCTHRREWFSFIENLMLVGLLQGLAALFHSPILHGLWFVSLVFLLVPVVRGIVRLTGALMESLPWARIETLPRLISFPAVTTFSLILAVALVVVGDYTAFQIGKVAEAIAKSHLGPP